MRRLTLVDMSQDVANAPSCRLLVACLLAQHQAGWLLHASWCAGHERQVLPLSTPLIGADQGAVSLTGWLCGQVPGNKAAIGQQYNAASDRYISHDGVVRALAEAAGVEANIVYYDTKAVSLAKVPSSQSGPPSWLQALLQRKQPDLNLCVPQAVTMTASMLT